MIDLELAAFTRDGEQVSNWVPVTPHERTVLPIPGGSPAITHIGVWVHDRFGWYVRLSSGSEVFKWPGTLEVELSIRPGE